MKIFEEKDSGIISATIPIKIDDGVYLDAEKARAFGMDLSKKYCFNQPYPHIVIDDFLPVKLAYEILLNFPNKTNFIEKEYDLNHIGIQVNKRQISPNSTNTFCRNLFGFFNSASFLEFLEGITKINGLISDSYFIGGGFHEISNGGKLSIHADFRINEKLNLNRRLNVLIYLNENWDENWGGHLEIWDKKMQNKIHSISPIFNRCVIFNTDATSYHGHPDPIKCPIDITRKSIALYYYTASNAIYNEIPSSSTMYLSRPNEDALTKRNAYKLRLQNYVKDLLPPILFRGLRKLKTSLLKIK